MEAMCNIVSFNMHGFRQGKEFLPELCTTHDVVFLQEHWLSSADSASLNCIDSHVLYASYAVDSALSKGVLYGRPFGGVAVLIRRELACHTKLISCADRFIIILIDDLVLCNIYMPCNSSPNYVEMYANTLAEISNCINECVFY